MTPLLIAVALAATLAPTVGASPAAAGPPPDQTPPATLPPAEHPPAAPATGAPVTARFPYFVGARLGAFLPTGDAPFGPELESGLDYEVGLGLSVTRLLAAELSVGHYVATATEGSWLFSRLHYEYDLGVTVVSASARLSLATSQRFDLYALAGAGLYEARLTAKAISSDTVISDTSTTERLFGFHVGAGVTFAVASRVRLGAELKYASVNGKYSAPGDPTKFNFGGLRAGGGIELRL